MRLRVGLLVLMLAAAAAAFALGSAATTIPTKTVLVQVLISDNGIIVAKYLNEISGNGQPVYAPMPGTVPRGDFLKFLILNHGKKVHDFQAFGKKTKRLKPGAKASFNKYAKVRGSFVYRSTLDKGKKFRGTIVIA